MIITDEDNFIDYITKIIFSLVGYLKVIEV